MKEEEWLFTTRWVHLFEEDTAKGAVYRPEDAKVPLSRRPRERLDLRRDGRASLFLPAPDDRLVENAAEWSFRDGEILVRTREGRELRITERSRERLLVR
jgi:hypothetical protein